MENEQVAITYAAAREALDGIGTQSSLDTEKFELLGRFIAQQRSIGDQVMLPRSIACSLVRAAEWVECRSIEQGLPQIWDDSIRAGLEYARERGLAAPSPSMAQQQAREVVVAPTDKPPFQRALEGWVPPDIEGAIFKTP